MSFRAIVSKNGTEFDLTCLHSMRAWKVKLEDGTELVLHEEDGWDVRLWTIYDNAEQV